MKRILNYILIFVMLLSLYQPIKTEAKEAPNGKQVIKYANKFIGGPYKYGGNSLTNGCDCSGFVVQVYKKFGIDLSCKRNSTLLRTVGKKVSVKNIKKGDIVCYNHHVAIYAGNDKIVEAQSSKAGITNTRGLRPEKIITIRRVL